MDEQCRRQLLFLIIATHLCQVLTVNYDTGVDLNNIEYLGSDQDPASEFQKRLSRFVRIGRGLSSFVRIGRNKLNGDNGVYEIDELPEVELTDSNDGAFNELEPATYDESEKQLIPVLGYDGNYDDAMDTDMTTDGIEKRGGAFIRMGKFPTSAFLRSRTGRISQLAPAANKYYRRTGRIGHSSFIRIGKRDTTEALRRLESEEAATNGDEKELQRFHKYRDQPDVNDTDDDQGPKRWLKFGRDIDDDNEGELFAELPDEPTENIDNVADELHDLETNDDLGNKRYSSFVRIGKSGDDMNALGEDPELASNQEIGKIAGGPAKRFSSFVRIGRDAQKRRLSSFVRIGKNHPVPYNPYNSKFNKRMSSFVRIGKGNNPYNDGMDKRISSFVRIGKSHFPLEKRYSSFVRIGKSSGYDVADDVNKRYSSFVRIGKDTRNHQRDLEKRLSSFIRVGKGDQDYGDDLDKRISSFVRIGKNIQQPDKRYSSFVRIGKNSDNNPDKRLSSFIRVGKNDNGESLNKGDVLVDTDLPTYFTPEQGHVIDKRSSEEDVENSNNNR